MIIPHGYSSGRLPIRPKRLSTVRAIANRWRHARPLHPTTLVSAPLAIDSGEARRSPSLRRPVRRALSTRDFGVEGPDRPRRSRLPSPRTELTTSLARLAGPFPPSPEIIMIPFLTHVQIFVVRRHHALITKVPRRNKVPPSSSAMAAFSAIFCGHCRPLTRVTVQTQA